MQFRNSKQQLFGNEHFDDEKTQLKDNDGDEESRMNLLFLKDNKSEDVKATILVDIYHGALSKG